MSWQRFMHNESLRWQQKKVGFQEQWAAVARKVEMHRGQPAAAPAPGVAAAGETGPARLQLQQGDTTAAEPAPVPAAPQPMQAAAAQVGPAGADAAQPMQAEVGSAEEGPAPVAAQPQASQSAEPPKPALRLPHAVLPSAQPMRLRHQALAAGKRRRAEAGGEGEQDEVAGAEQSASSALPLDSVRGSGCGASLPAACWREHQSRTCMPAGSVCSALPLLAGLCARTASSPDRPTGSTATATPFQFNEFLTTTRMHGAAPPPCCAAGRLATSAGCTGPGRLHLYCGLHAGGRPANRPPAGPA